MDEEWLTMVEDDVREFLKGTTLANVPIFKVSSVTGQGVRELLLAVDDLVKETEDKPARGRVRLPIDRIFTITGFGTIVTGTLWSGTIKVGDNLKILPGQHQVRVRSLQVHGRKVEEAPAGLRVAANLVGVEVSEVDRGSVLLTTDYLENSHRFDVHLQLLPSAPRTLKNRDRIRLHLGTSEVLGRIILLDREELEPEGVCYAQVQTEEPLVAAKNDHFVIRTYSPMLTIGGGTVIDPIAPKHRRFSGEILNRLETVRRGSPRELILQELDKKATFLLPKEIATRTGLLTETVSLLQELTGEGTVQCLEVDGQHFYLSSGGLAELVGDIASLIKDYQIRYPLRRGIPRELLRSKLPVDINRRLFQNLIQTLSGRGLVEADEVQVWLPGWLGEPVGKQADLLSKIEHEYLTAKFNPPAWDDISQNSRLTAEEKEEYLQYLLHNHKSLVKINEDIIFHREILEEAKKLIREAGSGQKSFTLGEIRDALGTSRKFVLPLLEYFDQNKFTRRVGDQRILWAK